MIDWAKYTITQDEDTKKFTVCEELDGHAKEFNSIEECAKFIESDLIQQYNNS